MPMKDVFLWKERRYLDHARWRVLLIKLRLSNVKTYEKSLTNAVKKSYSSLDGILIGRDIISGKSAQSNENRVCSVSLRLYLIK